VSKPRAEPVYIDGASEPVFGFFHEHSAPRGELAVLICPPFGWDEVCSYRSRRAWADQLASHGHPTLRIDLPGTGDSAGATLDLERTAQWAAAIGAAAAWLRTSAGCPRVAAIGIGLGGLLVCQAIAEGAAIEELVLWATPARGRTFLRELRAFAQLEHAWLAAPGQAPLAMFAPGATGAGGFALGAEATRSLEALALAELPMPAEQLRRALLLERDGISVDARLRTALEGAGAVVNVAPGEGYGAMTAPPQEAKPPASVFARVDAWLSESPREQAQTPAAPRRESDHPSVALKVGAIDIRETPVRLAHSSGELFGILAEPAGPRRELCAVLLNAGMIHRSGPNRMWVDIARAWAARGVPTLRLDFLGIGDSDDDGRRHDQTAELYGDEIAAQLTLAIDSLQARGLGPGFVLAGLCSGGYWAFRGALTDTRVLAAFMLNPRALVWDPSLDLRRDLRRALSRPSRWPRLLRSERGLEHARARVREAPRAIGNILGRGLTRRGARLTGGDELDRSFDRLGNSAKHILLAFSGEEPLHEELLRQGRMERLERWPNVELSGLPGRDHTLRPIEAQATARALLDHALERQLDMAPTRPTVTEPWPELEARRTSRSRPRPRVLITNCEERSMLAASRGLHRAGYDVGAVSFSALAPTHWSRSCRWRVRFADARHDAELFVEHLRDELRRRHYDALIPGSDTALLAISMGRDRLEGLSALGLPTPAVLEAVFSRETLAVHAEKAGLVPAESIFCADAEQAHAAAHAFGFPLVLKSACIATTSGRRVIAAPKGQLVDAEADLDGALVGFQGGLLVQRCVAGSLLSLGGVIAGGRLLGVAVARYHRMWPPKSGSVTFGETIDPPPGLVESVHALLCAIGWEGIFELELIESEQGGFVPIDLNPRPYGSMALATAAGAPLAAIWCDWLLGRNPVARHARPGFLYRWEDGELRHLRARLQQREYKAAAEVLLPHRRVVHAHFSPSDPLPLAARALFLEGVTEPEPATHDDQPPAPKRPLDSTVS
jgi:predicted ATP-grasp superfamily ATP-dependent carboligase/alpha/beta superfamily hydrolase